MEYYFSKKQYNETISNEKKKWASKSAFNPKCITLINGKIYTSCVATKTDLSKQYDDFNLVYDGDIKYEDPNRPYYLEKEMI